MSYCSKNAEATQKKIVSSTTITFPQKPGGEEVRITTLRLRSRENFLSLFLNDLILYLFGVVHCDLLKATLECGNDCGNKKLYGALVLGKLTALKVRSAKEAGRYQDGNGLMLLVKESGARSWLLRIQLNGRRRDFGLGSANDVSLAQARINANFYRQQCLQGIDPSAARKAARAEQEGIPSFERACEIVYEENRASWKNAKHAAQWISSLKAYAVPYIGKMKIDKIEGPHVRELLLAIWLSKPETARRVRQRVGTVLDWAHAKGYRPNEAPMRSLAKGLPKQPKKDNHFSAMPYDECATFMEGLRCSDTIGRLALRFTILTACRSGEVRGASWQEIDLSKGVWTIPADRMKAGKEHIVPLSHECLDLLASVQKFWNGKPKAIVFPGKADKPISDMTLTKVLRDSGNSHYTVHGFRSSFRDWAAEQTDFAGEVVEAALAHTIKNRVEAAYRRTNYLEKRRVLMEDWAGYLRSSLENAEELLISPHGRQKL